MMLTAMLPCQGGSRPVRCEKISLLRIRVKTERSGFPGPFLAINVQENLHRMAYLWNDFIACGDFILVGCHLYKTDPLKQNN